MTSDVPTLILAGVIVGVSIFLISEANSKAGWGLAVVLLLAYAAAHDTFGHELVLLLSGEKQMGDGSGGHEE